MAMVYAFEIVQPDTREGTALLHASGYYVDGNSNLRVFLRQDEIRQRFPGFVLDRPYTVRATLILDVGNGGQSGMWSDAFIRARVSDLRALAIRHERNSFLNSFNQAIRPISQATPQPMILASR